ncbi:hypothetical protein RRG08_064592 [Elysia crispata]|uniref:Uncharacterized protein n=1 Tax=Elysia crispata TaxID=231223 RepID=A0AAE1B975_9GAST|nr:hypothetical protein RRG08_064592 [Elysia crispata]
MSNSSNACRRGDKVNTFRCGSRVVSCPWFEVDQSAYLRNFHLNLSSEQLTSQLLVVRPGRFPEEDLKSLMTNPGCDAHSG